MNGGLVLFALYAILQGTEGFFIGTGVIAAAIVNVVTIARSPIRAE